MPLPKVPPRKNSARRNKRWLHRIFVEDWSLKLLALAIALALDFINSGRS